MLYFVEDYYLLTKSYYHDYLSYLDLDLEELLASTKEAGAFPMTPPVSDNSEPDSPLSNDSMMGKGFETPSVNFISQIMVIAL